MLHKQAQNSLLVDSTRNGFPVTVDLAAALSTYADRFITQDLMFAETYAPNGTVVGLGDICYRKRSANTLERIADEGPDVFYGNSSIATNTLETIRQTGGIMTEADLLGYRTIVRVPSNITYRWGLSKSSRQTRSLTCDLVTGARESTLLLRLAQELSLSPL